MKLNNPLFSQLRQALNYVICNNSYCKSISKLKNMQAHTRYSSNCRQGRQSDPEFRCMQTDYLHSQNDYEKTKMRKRLHPKIHTRLLFSFSQFEIYHNTVMLLPKTSSSDLRSLHSKPENKQDKKGKTGKALLKHPSFWLSYT